MAGRIPKLNYTPYYNQYTCTIGGVLHRLGKDEEEAQKRFRFLMREHERGYEPDLNIPFGDVADAYLDFVEVNFCADRYRHCNERLQEFKDHIGNGFKAKDLRPKHVDGWLHTKGKLTAGTERLYKSIILACLNWAAKPRNKKGGELIHENTLRGQLHLPAGESRGKDAVWTQETYDQVLKYGSPAFTDLVRILAWTGARMTTVIRIEARHYNKAQKRWDCADLARGKKSVKFVRLLCEEARELVERLGEQYPTGPIFRNAKGEPWDQDAPQIYLFNMQNKFLASKDLDWQEGLCMKGLRHTFASGFLQKYPNEIEYLRALLGHVDYKMIMSHYSHLIHMDAPAFKRLEGFAPFKVN
jgi:integrase